MITEEQLHKGAGMIATGLWKTADFIHILGDGVNAVAEIVNACGHVVLDSACKITEANHKFDVEPQHHDHIHISTAGKPNG